MCRDWMRVEKEDVGHFEVPLVHFFLNVLVQLVQLALQLLPPLLRRQVAEVFWSGALSDTTGRRGGGGEQTVKDSALTTSELK